MRRQNELLEVSMQIYDFFPLWPLQYFISSDLPARHYSLSEGQQREWLYNLHIKDDK